MRAVRSVFAGACGLLLLTGCGGTAEPVAAPTLAPRVTISESASPQTVSTGASPAPAQAMQSYVDASARGDDPEAMRQGLKLAAPGSAAFIYLAHLANTAEAAVDGGQPFTRRSVAPAGSDAFRACENLADEKTCATIGGFTADPTGKLVDLTVNKQQVGPRLSEGKGGTVTAGGARFTFLTAYKIPASNALHVTMRIETGAKPVTANIMAATYPGIDGKPRKAQGALGRGTIDARSSAIIFMAFELVNPGGEISLDGCAGKSCSGRQFTAKIPVG
jgi:hypothetical protein